MRLLYCSRDYTAHDLRFLRAFVAAGFETHYLRLESDGVPYVRDPLPGGASWVAWAGGGPPRPIPDAVEAYLPNFASTVDRIKPDVMHAGPVQSFGLMAALVRTVPFVLVSWGSDILVEAKRDAWYTWATRTAVRACAAFVCDSTAVLADARELAGGELAPHLCVPWGLDVVPERSNPQRRHAIRRELGWDDAIIVVATRSWHHGYRVPELVDVFATASAKVPRLRLALLGAGEEAPAVHTRIRAHRLEDRVIVPGMLPGTELRRLLSAADIYLSLVPSDGTSISLLEAMAHGLSVVVTLNAGNAQWVEDGRSGYLVPAADLAAWSERLVALATDRGAARRMAMAGREHTLAHANWSRNVPRLIALYRRSASRSVTVSSR